MDGARTDGVQLIRAYHSPIEPRLPDFLVIGAPKAGTTTLAADLASHPMLWLPARKELGYFDVRWRREPLDAYRADFAAAPPDRLVGEATPNYLHREGAMERIADCMPEVRLVAVLRDPVDRAWSHYWYNREALLVEGLEPAEAFARRSRDYFEPGLYGAHLRRVLDRFDRAQLLVLTLDEMAADAAAQFGAVCRHLGVSEHVPADVGRTRNAAYSVRWPFLRRQMYRFSAFERLPFRLGHRLEELNRRRLHVPPMPVELRSLVTDWYVEDTAVLEELLDRTIPWTDSVVDPRPADGTP